MAVAFHFSGIIFLVFICADVYATGVLLRTHSRLLADERPDATLGKHAAKQHIEERTTTPDPVHQEALETKAKYPILLAMHLGLQSFFGKNTEAWYHDWKLWAGLTTWMVVWARWLKYGYDEIYYQRALFAFGINMLILHVLQYAPSILVGMLIVCTCLCMQSLFQSWIWFKTANTDSDVSKEALATVCRHEEFDCDTLYLDLSLPFEQIVVLFVAQMGVWWFYMSSILANFNFNNVNYLFWLWGYLAMQITMIFNRGDDSVLGADFPVRDVYHLAKIADRCSFKLKDSCHEKGSRFQMSKESIITRGVMGYFCNAILREIMAYTIPLMLMGFSEPMDFVVYCVGVNFICTLDDMTQKKYVTTDRLMEAVEYEHNHQ